MTGKSLDRPRERPAAVSKAQVEDLAKLVAGERHIIGRMLPDHLEFDTFLGGVAGALFRNPDLARVAVTSPQSLFVALRQCAALGHMPGSDQFALTVRRFGEDKRETIVGIEQYQGVIERMYRSGGVQSIHAEVVCMGDDFRRSPDGGPPFHRPANGDWMQRNTLPANLAGAYAYAYLTGGGCSNVVIMGRAEIMRHREAADMYKIWDGPFGKSMWLKTVTHELEKWVPTSPQYLAERARVAAVADVGPIRQEPADRSAAAVAATAASPPEPAVTEPAEEPWPPTAQPPDAR